MSHLVYLKQQIQSIQATKKITHAIRLVSISLYTKLEKQNIFLKNYTNTIRRLFSDIVYFNPSWKSPLLYSEDILDTNPLFIIVSSTKGLCGSLNSNLFRYIDHALVIDKHQNPKFITIGSKATKFAKEKKLDNIIYHYNELTSNNFITIADDLVVKITGTQTLISSVVFFSNEAISFFMQKPRKFTLLPATLEPLDTSTTNLDESLKESPIWEQENTYVLEYTAIKFIRATIVQTLFQALLSEYSARFIAMDNSTTNAEKYIEKLTLFYNKTRQGLITKEVAELSSGFSSLNQ
jgi:F-type H+-transporting ATPase subunit gamma